jgi:hypothetical protein
MAVAIDDRFGSLIVGGEEQPSCGTGPGCSAYPTKQTNIVAAAVGSVVCLFDAAGVHGPFGIAGVGVPPKSHAARKAEVSSKLREI